MRGIKFIAARLSIRRQIARPKDANSSRGERQFFKVGAQSILRIADIGPTRGEFARRNRFLPKGRF